MTHDHDKQEVAAPREHEEFVKGAGPKASREVQRPDVADTWKKVQAILAGRGNAEELPRLVSLLDHDRKYTFMTEHFTGLGKHVPGDVILEVGEVVAFDAVTILDEALVAKTAPSKTALRRFLTEIDAQKLAAVTGDTCTKLRARLSGPLLDELPILAQRLWAFTDNVEFLNWFVETTAPAIVAFKFADIGDKTLAETLNKIPSAKKWTWVDHVHLATGYEALAQLALHAPDAVKTKLQAQLGDFADKVSQKRFRTQHAQDVQKALDSHAGARELLDAVANQGRIDLAQTRQVLEALEKLEPSADDVLALTRLLSLSGAEIVELLLRSKGCTAHHVTTYLMENGGLSQLSTSKKLLGEVRKKIPGLRIHDVLASAGHTEADLLFENAGLRDWFFDTARPEDLLWFCGGSDNSARACKLMDRRDPSWKWVYELTAAENHRQLRAVALNCGEAKITQHIRQVLLAERAPLQETVEGAQAPDHESRSGGTGRLLDALDGDGDVMARIADLDDAQRARVGRVDGLVEKLGQKLSSTDFARAATLLGLSFESCIAHSPAQSPAMVAYLRTRPAAEQVEAAQQSDLVERSLTFVHPDPLVVFFALRDPEQLAKAIEKSSKLLKVLIKHGEPNVVADLLSRDAVIAKTEKLLEDKPELLSYLPRHRKMTAKGKAGVERLEQHAKGDAKEELQDVVKNDHDPWEKVREESVRLHGASKESTLAAALGKLMESGGSPASALTLIGEFSRDQVRTLLSDEAHGPVVRELARFVGLPAHVVFPHLSVETLLSMQNSRAWLFDFDHPYVLLDLIATRPAAIEKVAAEIDHGTGSNAFVWFGRLPVGSALSDTEARTLDRIQPGIKSAGLLRQLFMNRFGIVAPAEYDEATMRELYKACSRLPRAHLNQERIKDIAARQSVPGVGGSWNGETISISPDKRPGEDTDTFHGDSKRMSKVEIQRLYGWNDVELAQQIKQGNVKYLVGADQYELVAEKLDDFTSVVLHEIGHSIDDILGRRTEPVYGYAAWRSYAAGDFDAWATEMGGWDKVSAGDQKKIREVWLDAMRSKAAVYELVDSEHPAMAARYEEVGIVAAARLRKDFEYTEPVTVNDRTFVMNTYYQRFFSLSAKAADTKPTPYALYAPAEYFAECYVEYYREVDGSAASRGKKGGSLPGPVRNWYTQHVDSLKYDPQRFEKPEEEESDAG